MAMDGGDIGERLDVDPLYGQDETWIVRTDTYHVLIYDGCPTKDPEHGWPMPGHKFRTADGRVGLCVERFCWLTLRFLHWQRIALDRPTRIYLGD